MFNINILTVNSYFNTLDLSVYYFGIEDVLYSTTLVVFHYQVFTFSVNVHVHD